MKVRKNERKDNTVFIEVEEDYSKFKEAVDKTLVEAGRSIKIPGFRKGKAPREMIERVVDQEVLESQAAQNLIGDLYPRILDETRIEVVDFPKVEILQSKRDKPFIFKIAVDVYPEVKLGKYKGVKLEKETAEVTEEDILKVLGNLRQRFSKDGEDEKRELLPLDDEFAKKVSRHGTLAELKEEMKEAMQRDKEVRIEADLKNKLIASVASDAKVDIPGGMIEREVNVMLDELSTSLSQSNLTLDDYLKGIKKEEKTLREELSKSAEIRVKGKLVLGAVAKAEKMEINEQELEKELEALAQSSGKSLEEMKNSLEEGAREYIEDYLLRSKALAFIMEKAKIKTVDKKRKQ